MPYRHSAYRYGYSGYDEYDYIRRYGRYGGYTYNANSSSTSSSSSSYNTDSSISCTTIQETPCTKCGIINVLVCNLCQTCFTKEYPSQCQNKKCLARIEPKYNKCKGCDKKLCYACYVDHIKNTPADRKQDLIVVKEDETTKKLEYSYFRSICKLCKRRLCKQTYMKHCCTLCSNIYCKKCVPVSNFTVPVPLYENYKKEYCYACWVYLICKLKTVSFPKDVIMHIIKLCIK